MPETGRRPTRNVFRQPPKLLNLEPGPSGGLLGDHAADLGTSTRLLQGESSSPQDLFPDRH